MKIEQSTVTKLLLSELENLDPVTVFLEDFEPGKGKITISCYGKSWSSYWGAMSGDDVATFFRWVSPDYVIGCFDTQLHSTRFSGAALVKKARAQILKDRRRFDIDAATAREQYDEAGDLGQVPSVDYLGHAYPELMEQLFGYEWWHSAADASEPNPEYLYLERIIKAVQAGLAAAAT
jgi:hypothetical protein